MFEIEFKVLTGLKYTASSMDTCMMRKKEGKIKRSNKRVYIGIIFLKNSERSQPYAKEEQTGKNEIS
jgi:hypothetical protein